MSYTLSETVRDVASTILSIVLLIAVYLVWGSKGLKTAFSLYSMFIFICCVFSSILLSLAVVETTKGDSTTTKPET